MIAVRICLIAAAVAACAPATGDFGRPAPSVVHDTLMPAAGRSLAHARGEPASFYRMTDEERRLRDLSWSVVMPPHERQYVDRTLAELRRTRILPPDRLRMDVGSYVRTLIGEPYRSSVARYVRLKEDVEADIGRVEPFQQSAARVVADDRARSRALAGVPDVTASEDANARARIDENALLVAWVMESFDERLAAYRYALDRLVLETPDRISIDVAASIDVLERVLAGVRPLGPGRGVFKG